MGIYVYMYMYCMCIGHPVLGIYAGAVLVRPSDAAADCEVRLPALCSYPCFCCCCCCSLPRTAWLYRKASKAAYVKGPLKAPLSILPPYNVL